MKRIIYLALTLVFSSGVAWSQSPLTSSKVEHFINSLERLRALPETDAKSAPMKGDQIWTSDLASDTEALKEKMMSPFSSSLPEMRQHESFSKGLRIIKSEGFGDEVEWAGVGDRVMRAYAALKMENVEPEMDEKMAKALREIENMQVPEEMKEKMRAAMSVSKSMAKTTQDVPQSDIDALKPHIERFEKMAEASSAKHMQ